MIKCSLIVATSLDGFIAKDEHHPAFWTSKEDKKRFVQITKRAGAVVMGSTTYETIGKPLKDRLNIVYSRNKKYEGVEMTQEEPKKLLEELEKRGYKEVAICGGSHIYTMFMKAGVIDKIYITIEPVIFGKGMKIFNEELFYNLKLENKKITNTGTLFFEYSISKLPLNINS